MTISESAQRRTILAGLLGAAGAAAMVESAQAQTQPKSAPASVASDIVLIVNALNIYGLAIDSMQWHLFDLIFAPDCHVGRYADLAAFKVGFAAVHEKMVRSQHAIMGHVVNVTGNTAQSWCYSAFRTTRKDARGEYSHEGQGFYNDEWARTKAGWRITKRQSGTVWMGQDFAEIGDTSKLFRPRVEGPAGNIAVMKALAPT